MNPDEQILYKFSRFNELSIERNIFIVPSPWKQCKFSHKNERFKRRSRSRSVFNNLSILFGSCKHLQMLYIYNRFLTIRNDYHLCQLLSLLRKNSKVLFFGLPEALCLTNSRYNELLWVSLKVRYTGSSLYFHM